MPQANTQPIYRAVLRQAFLITIKNRQLWILGFFATFIASTGVYDLAFRGVQGAVNRGVFRALIIPQESLVLDVFSMPLSLLEFGTKLTVLLPIFIFLALICAVFIWLGVVSQGGIIFAVHKALRKTVPGAKESFCAGGARFWPLLGANLAAKILASLFLSGITVPIFIMLKSDGLLPTALYFALFLLLVPGALVVSFLGILSSAGIITKKLSLWEAIKTAWTQFSKHWLVCIEMAFIILGLGILVTVGIIFAVLILSVPFVVLAVIASLFAGSAGAGFVFLIAFAVLFLFVITIGSAFTTFQIASWTLLFLRFTEKGAVAKIIRIVSAMPKYLTPKRR